VLMMSSLLVVFALVCADVCGSGFIKTLHADWLQPSNPTEKQFHKK
jgi:hypothetical protein